jgi:PAS domain-containing protein
VLARPKNVVLILAREFATRLTLPMFVTDAEGNLVFFNEPAEELLGRTFAEAGEIAADEWESLFQVEDLEGRPMALERIPGGVALLERRPAHCNLRITGLDGTQRSLFVTAFPLLSRGDELQGTVSVFWEEPAAPSSD